MVVLVSRATFLLWACGLKTHLSMAFASFELALFLHPSLAFLKLPVHHSQAFYLFHLSSRSTFLKHLLHHHHSIVRVSDLNPVSHKNHRPPLHDPLTAPPGIPAPVLGYGALNALLFVSYNRTLLLLGEPDPTSPSTPNALGKVFLAGAIGGLATFVVSAPTELIKCRAQVFDSLSSAHGLGRRSGAAGGEGSSSVSSWNVARETWRAEGVRGFYRGGVVTAVRDAVGYAF